MAFGAGRFICSAHGILRLLQKLSATCFLCFRGIDQPSQTVFVLCFPFSNFQPCWGLPERVFWDILDWFFCFPQKCCWLGEIFGCHKLPGLVAVWSHQVLAARQRQRFQLQLQLPGRSAGKVDTPDTWSISKMPVFLGKKAVRNPQRNGNLNGYNGNSQT